MNNKTNVKKTTTDDKINNIIESDTSLEPPEIFPSREITKPLKPTESHFEILSYNKLLMEFHKDSFNNIINMNNYINNALESDVIKLSIPAELYQTKTE